MIGVFLRPLQRKTDRKNEKRKQESRAGQGQITATAETGCKK
jgi:hypothetical protein